jgi:amidase
MSDTKLPGDEVCWMSATALAARIRDQQLSPTEVLDMYLQRIDAFNLSLTAVVSLDVDSARKQAEAANAALARGDVVGPLHGVPMTLKDGHDVAGLRTTLGTELFDRIADRDGTVAQRLRAAGAIIVGHSNVPPFLADYQSSNSVFGTTVNPWDRSRTAGGSSGGAAAALAAGLTPVEVASDLAGSLRLPPHFCGVYGLKTTEHRVPLTGFFSSPPGVPRPVRIMSCIGPMARDLDDLDLVLRITAGPDGEDSDVPPVPVEPLAPRSLSDLRLAVIPALPHSTIAKDLQDQVERLAGQLGERGACVDRRLPEVDWSLTDELFTDLLAAITGLFAPGSELRDEQRSLAWYLEALDYRDRLLNAWNRFFDDHDALICPPAMTTAFEVCEPGSPLHVDGNRVEYSAQAHPMVFANLVGLPALTIPVGRDPTGLPVGAQIVGPHWSEARLLEIAHALEEAGITPGFQRPPGY